METFNGNRAIILHMEAVCWYPRIRDGQQSHKIEKCAGTPMSITTKYGRIKELLNTLTDEEIH